MTKTSVLYLVGGLVVGAAAVATFGILYSRKYTNEINDLIEENESLRRGEVVENMEDPDYIPEEIKEEESEEDPEDIPIKKYHHYKAASGETAQSIFEKKENDKVTEGQKAVNEKPNLIDYKDIIGVDEINDTEFLEYQENDYEPVYLNYDGNRDLLLWGKGTDSEIMAEAKFGMKRDAIIGPAWRYFTDYISEEDNTGAFYIKNDNLKKVFEVVCELDPNEDMIEVSADV